MLLGGAAEAAAKPAITDARLGVEPGLTRVVISLTQRSDFQVFTLADPYRVVIDMSEVDWKVPSGTKLQGQGLVAGMRYGLFKAGTSRVVLDLMEPVGGRPGGVRCRPTKGEPLRLLVDLRPVPDTQFRAQLKSNTVAYSAIAAIAPVTKPAARTLTSTGSGAAPATGALGGSAAKQPTEEPKRGKPLIVIDPGHGGIDPGAVGDHHQREAADPGGRQGAEEGAGGDRQVPRLPDPQPATSTSRCASGSGWRAKRAPTCSSRCTPIPTTIR